jgi:fatty-acyl-CoA synthase
LVDEQGNEVGANEIGEFILKGDTVTPGYWKNKEATENTIRDGWFHTGDLMKRDEEGYYYVVDRIKNMYISGGENVYPAEVEHLIMQMDEVKDVAIIGVTHEKWGETGKAFIVKKDGVDLTEQQVIDFCLKNLAKYKIPQYIEFLDELPLNNAGKIDRRVLRHDEKY